MCQKSICCKAVKLAAVVGEGRGGCAAARRHPGQVAETSAAIQALLPGHIPAFPTGTVLLPIAADGSLPVEAHSAAWKYHDTHKY